MKKNNTTSQEDIKKLLDDEDAGFDSKVESSIKSENRRLWRVIFLVVFTLLSILVVGCMVSIYNAAYSVNEYFGYAVGILLLLLLVFLIGIPTIRIFVLPYYIVSKEGGNSALVRHTNAKVVRRVAENLIEYHANTSQGYVTEDNLKNLALMLAKGKRTEINQALKQIYDTDVNAKVRSIILKSATKAFCCTAISQNDKVDALSVLFINIRMIKSILFAYGTRPSMYKLIKVYTHIIINSLIAYGMQNISLSNILTKFVKATASLVPALGTLIDSAVQGATGAILTLIIGYKTKSYVYKEFKMVVKEELEYDKSTYADKELELALEDYNNSKGLMQAQVQNAKRAIEESTRDKTKLQQVQTLTDEIPVTNESADSKRRRLANEDLELLMGTGKKLKNNGRRKKEINGDSPQKPKRKGSFSWSVHTNKKSAVNGDAVSLTSDVVADEVDEDVNANETADNRDNANKSKKKKGKFNNRK